MFLLFLRSWWKELLIGTLVIGLGGMVANKLINYGKAAATEEFTQKIDDYNTKLNKRLDDLEENSKQLVLARDNKTEEFSKSVDTKLASILAKTKDKPMFVFEPTTNKCSVTPEFVTNYNDLLTGGKNE